MKVVLDTNVLLISIPSGSVYRPIFDALINGEFELILSNEILSEYVEIIEQKANAIVANNVAETLLNLDNLNKIEVHFAWQLIEKDPDDNKYTDAAIAGAADLIITNDHHFNVLKTIDFPKIGVMSIDEFLATLKK